MIEQIDEKFGRIDILINNAAGILFVQQKIYPNERMEFGH